MACNDIKEFENKNPQKVSKDIVTSQKLGMFITEYSIYNTHRLDSSYVIPQMKIWEERKYKLVESKENEKVIVSESENNIVFKMTKNNSDSFSADFIKGWVLWLDKKKTPNSYINNMVVVPITKKDGDELSFTIYKKTKISDFKNNIVPVFSFSIRRK